MTGGRPDIVILAGGMWGERWTTYQRIAAEFGKHFRVLYIEGNYSWGKLIKGLILGGQPINPMGRFRQLADEFYVLTPPPRLPLRHFFRPIGLLNQRMLRSYMRRGMERIGMQSPVLWTFLHQSDWLIGRCAEEYSVYHCVDYWPWLMPRVFLMGSKSRIEQDERITAGNVAFTVSTSRFLRNRLAKINDRSYHVPNAVDYELFVKACDDELSVPHDMLEIPRPVLGFSGSLEAKSNVDLLRRLALEDPSRSIVFIGHHENVTDIGKLMGLANTYFLGLKPQSELPAYLRQFDVCLVPFRRTAELASISPLKIFEYLAAGRPVVATNYDEIAHLGSVVYLSASDDEFIANVRRALEQECEMLRAQRKEFARQNTWQDRVMQLIDIMHRYGASTRA